MDARSSKAAEEYRELIMKLERAIVEGTGVEVDMATALVVCKAAVINPYYPEAWGADDDRQIEAILKQALDRITADIRQCKLSEGVTLENYQAYAREIQRRYEDVKNRFLAQWAKDRVQYAELVQATG